MSDFDRTSILRGTQKEVRDRCRWMAESMYRYWAEDSSRAQMVPLAQKAIEAACVFEQEWQVAATVEDLTVSQPDEDDFVQALMEAQNQ